MASISNEIFQICSTDVAKALNEDLKNVESDIYKLRKTILKKAKKYFNINKQSSIIFSKSQSFFKQLNQEGTQYTLKQIETFENREAQAFAELYILCINFLQKIHLFDPNAKIVIYSESGYRYEADFSIQQLNAHWKSKKDGQIAVSLNQLAKIKYQEGKNQQELDKIKKNRESLQQDYNNYKKLIWNTYRAKDKHNSKLSMGGYIAEAFERHYQNQLLLHQEEKINWDQGIEHYGGWNQAWLWIRDSMGGAPGWQHPDVGFAQVKNYNATFFNISSIEALLGFIDNLPKFKAEELVQAWNKKDTSKFSKQMSNEVNRRLQLKSLKNINISGELLDEKLFF